MQKFELIKRGWTTFGDLRRELELRGWQMVPQKGWQSFRVLSPPKGGTAVGKRRDRG